MQEKMQGPLGYQSINNKDISDKPWGESLTADLQV